MNKLDKIKVIANTHSPDEIEQVQKISKTIPIDYKLLYPFKYQDLIKKGNISEIEQSIRKIGLLEPVIAVKNNERYEILSGHTRYEALVRIIEGNEFKGYKFRNKMYFKEIPVDIMKDINETTKLSIFYDSNVTQRDLSREEKRELAKQWAKLIINNNNGMNIKNRKKFIAQKANVSEKTAQTIINEVKGKKEKLSEIDKFVKKLSNSSRIIRNQKFSSLTNNDRSVIYKYLSELEQEINDLKTRCQV